MVEPPVREFRLLLGEPETTIGLKYESTDDGRNAARHEVRHERSVHAGSGDPKKAAELAAGLMKVAAPPLGKVGDVDEVDIAEEELGVTTPRR